MCCKKFNFHIFFLFFSFLSIPGKLYSESPSGGFKTYELDISHTKVGFEISHLMIATVDGQFNKFSGSFEYNDQNQELKNAKIELEVGSINTNEPKRDEHLRSPDFFDVEKFPKITFENVKLISLAGKPKNLTGIIVMHGIKKDISLDVDFKGAATDPWGNQKIVFNLKGTIDRKDFGLIWNKKLDSGGFLVGDQVDLIIRAEADLKKS